MRRRIGAVLSAGVVWCAAVCVAQGAGAGTPASAKPAFEVASVKQSPSMDTLAKDMQAGRMPKIGTVIEGTRAEYSFLSLRDLIAIAYDVKPYQVSGPEWLGSERFNIVAKMPDGASKEDAPAMLDALLAERFKLSAHRATEERPVTALVVAKGGPKLKEASAPPPALDENAPLKPGQMKINMGDGPAIVTRNPDGTATTNMGAKGTFTQSMDMQSQVLHLKADSITLDGFADLLSRLSQMGNLGGSSGKQTVNLTGLKGYYQVSIDLSLAELMANARAQGMGGPPPPPPGAAGEASDPGGGGASVASSVQALGLRLESRRAPVEQLVVDHIEKTPTED